MFLIITALIAVFTIVGLFAGHANPVHETALAMIVYVMPYLIIGNVIMFFFWLVRKRWHWLCIPTITLLMSIPYIGTIYQINIFHSDTTKKSSFKIATYNVAQFGRELSGFKAEDILTEMKRQNVDIFCIQEYMEHIGGKNNTESYKTYFASIAKGRDDMMIMSHRFPIKRSGIIDFGPTNNSGMWADLDVNGRMLRVFNVHLETTGFNRTVHKIAKRQMQGTPLEENAIIKSIYGNYTRGMVIRARQANIMAREIQKSPYPVIVCGDFNDVPYSYTYNLMKGDLVDGFKECGEGFMRTYRRQNVRIDYIFHSETLTGEKYYTQQMSYSDHDPVFMRVTF
jgi:endonuclease/exonuclease/phosphatase family metal-dependent hydrolase